MRILFVSEYFPPQTKGGGEINLHLLAKTVAKKIEVHVATSFHPHLKLFEIVDGIKVHRCIKTARDVRSVKDNFRRSIVFPDSTIFFVKKLCQLIKPDLIHFIGTSILAAKELSKLSIPLVATIESYPTLCPKGDRLYNGSKECTLICSFSKFTSCQRNSSEIGKMRNKFYLKYNPLFHNYLYNYFLKLRHSLNYCNLISISVYVQNILLQHGHQSVVIPNIIELESFNYPIQPKSELKLPVILYIGSLINSKGPLLLLKAIKGLDCRCDIYGTGILKPVLQEYIIKNKLKAKIYEPVPYEQIPRIYASSDLVVFPSLWPEPFGRIPLEAMAAGKPIIASSTGGISEIVAPRSDHSKTGLLFEPNNVADLRNKIAALLHNSREKELMSRNGRKIASHYSSRKITRLLLDEYELILKNNRRSRIAI